MKITLTPIMTLASLVLGLLASAGIGCSKGNDGRPNMTPADAKEFVSADLTLYVDERQQLMMDERGEPVKLQKRLDDVEQVRRLAAFFPGVGTGRQSQTGSGSMQRVGVVFTRANGKTVDVGSDFTSWGEGSGGFPTEPGLEEYVRALFKGSKPDGG